MNFFASKFRAVLRWLATWSTFDVEHCGLGHGSAAGRE